jgi:hypothetical protein
MTAVPYVDVQLAVEVHTYADPEAATGDAVLGYLPDPPKRSGRFHDPVPLDQAGRWPRSEANLLAGEYDGVHKWRGKRARRWAIAVPAELDAEPS